MSTKTKKEHYVNNKEFLEAMIKYRKSVRKAKREKRTKPPVGDYLGSCFLKIANHLSYRPNFINYTFKDDMISDGIENCLQYLDNFDGKKSNNPFAYYTATVNNSFTRVLNLEKRNQTIRDDILIEQGHLPSYGRQIQHEEELRELRANAENEVETPSGE